FMQHNPSGLMPVLRDGPDWIQDSDKIIVHVEKKFKEPSLKTPHEFKIGFSSVFPVFTNWLKSKDRSAPAKTYQRAHSFRGVIEETLLCNVLLIYLVSQGPYIAGKTPTDSNFALAPKLRHAGMALEHFMDFVFPSNLR
ncbi:hypothetical protein SELMODRAFT_130267, partial [Selaginella moellendorffii]